VLAETADGRVLFVPVFEEELIATATRRGRIIVYGGWGIEASA